MIARCLALEVNFYDCLRESFGPQARGGIHLSGLVSPRQEFWQHAVPMVPTDDELGYFTAGRGHEDALQRFLGQDFKHTEEALIDGILLRPDFEAISNRIIPLGEHAEFKTRRANLPKNDDEAQEAFSHYRHQVRGYMALKRRNTMYLVVFSLVEGKTGDALSRSHPVFAVYVETMTDAELEAERQALQARRATLLLARAAHAAGDTNAVEMELLMMPLCEDWMCGKATAAMPIKCLTPGCGKEYESSIKWARQHGAQTGHNIPVKWGYLPRCKWYQYCRPWEIDSSRGGR